MTWTTDLPTVPGWYWVENHDGTKEIVLLERDDVGRLDRLIPYYAGDDRTYLSVAEAHFGYEHFKRPIRWAGPLEPPA